MRLSVTKRPPSVLLLGIVLCVLFGGCLGGPTAGRGQSQSLSGGPAAAPPGPSHTPAPGNATPIAVRTQIDDESILYSESNDSVRYVAGWRHVNHEAMEQGAPPTREPMYEWVPFGRWAVPACASAASEAVRDHLDAELDGDLDPWLSVGGRGRVGDVSIEVAVETVLDRDGEVVSTPALPYATVRDHTPARVNATIVLEGREASCDLPVSVRTSVLRYN